MKRNKIIILLSILILVVILVYYNSNDKEKIKINDNIYKLTKNMSKEDVENLLGKSVKDIGFGMPVYLYQIDNDTVVLISYDENSKIMNATLQKNDETSEQLIGYDE
ncbi:MAG: hypothetical protein ACERKZ_10390 [Lachnotalea sp.]